MTAQELVDLRHEARRLRPTLPNHTAYTEHALAAWRGRMINEHGSARVFRALSEQLDRAGMLGAAECATFAQEERRHGVLCGAVVEALGGQATFVEMPSSYPIHSDVSRFEGCLRNVLSICCMSETVAVALISAERLAMEPGALRDLLEDILKDEIGHARFGWKLVAGALPRVDDAMRARLDRYLSVAFAHLERHELEHIDEGPGLGGDSASLGLCDGRAMRSLFESTVREVIVPRLEGMGFSAARAWEYRSEALAVWKEAV